MDTERLNGEREICDHGLTVCPDCLRNCEGVFVIDPEECRCIFIDDPERVTRSPEEEGRASGACGRRSLRSGECGSSAFSYSSAV